MGAFASEFSEVTDDEVGPFTGFGNFARKELRDWWNSWRLILVFTIPTLILTLLVFFTFQKQLQTAQRFTAFGNPALGEQELQRLVATSLVLILFLQVFPALYILITIFSCMGLLTTEKSTGTLAWNLTKPLGRTGLFVAKWLVATLVLWFAACLLPVAVATLCMIAYHGIQPDYVQMARLVPLAAAWIGLWVLLILTISLGFQSSAAVGGIAIAFWIVPFLFGQLMGQVFGEEVRDWILDRLGTRSPFWAAPLVADKRLLYFDTVKDWKEVWLYAYGGWMFFLAIFSLRVFNRQEIGS